MTRDDVFWWWFEENLSQVQDDISAASQAGGPSQLITAGIGDALANEYPGLVHEVGQAADGVFEIIISADGIRERFPKVVECVKRAPKITGWRVIAFRPRLASPPPSLDFSGTHFADSDFLYIPSRHENRVDIEILYRGAIPVTDQRLIGASYLFLDTALGEFDVEMHIGSIGRRSLPGNVPPPSNAVSLGQLVSMIDDWFPRRGQLQ